MKKYWLFYPIIVILTLVNVYLLVKIESRKKEIKQKLLSEKLITIVPTLTQKPKTTIAVVGDISLSREVNWQITQRGDPNFPFKKTKEITQKADLALGNLEGPLIENCPLTRVGFKFCGQKKNVLGLASAGFDLVNLANNHISNYGLDGVQQTMAILGENNIDHFNEEKISYKRINGLLIAFLGFDDTIKPVDENKMVGKISEINEEADFIIINFHWGTEYQKEPNKRQEHLAKLSIDNGADLIVGHHPHVLQPIKYYKGKPILYSLGNFVFDQMWSQETRTGAIAIITLEENKSLQIDVIPIRIYENSQPQIISEPEKTKIIQTLLPYEN